MVFEPTTVSTINARCPQPYLLAILIKWYIISLESETEISNLSESVSIPLVFGRYSLSPCGNTGFVFYLIGIIVQFTTEATI